VSLSPDHATAFEAVVDDYDAGRPSYPPSLYAALPPLAGRRVLELGAGTGLGTAGLLAAGADVVATDRGPRMLARLHAAHPPVPVAVARAEALPFADGSFDAVCCFAALNLFADPWRALDSATAVLRPGGRISIFTSVRGRSPLLRAGEAVLQSQSGMTMFERHEVVDALRARGFGEIRQRLTGVTQFVGGRLDS
jgi:SAM-dependent methyltransferase